MANETIHRLNQDGRRRAAPPRRLPAPANDNGAPVRQRLKQAAFLAALVLMAASLVLI